MPEVCKTCDHDQRDQIDIELARTNANTRIANKYDIPVNNIRWHKKMHLKPFVDKVRIKAEKLLMKDMLRFRPEVTYKPADKARHAQEQILNDLDTTSKILDRAQLYRAYATFLQEENKLAGNYINPQDNPKTIEDTAKAFDRHLKEMGWSKEKRIEALQLEYPMVESKEVN